MKTILHAKYQKAIKGECFMWGGVADSRPGVMARPHSHGYLGGVQGSCDARAILYPHWSWSQRRPPISSGESLRQSGFISKRRS